MSKIEDHYDRLEGCFLGIKIVLGKQKEDEVALKKEQSELPDWCFKINWANMTRREILDYYLNVLGLDKEQGKVEIEIRYFKKSSEWYADGTLTIPDNFKHEISDMRYYAVRKWVEQRIRKSSLSKDKVAVCFDDEVIGYPMMIYPKGASLCQRKNHGLNSEKLDFSCSRI